MQWPIPEMHEKFRLRMFMASKHRRSKRTISGGQNIVNAMFADVDITHTQSTQASGGFSVDLAKTVLWVQHPSRSKGWLITGFVLSDMTDPQLLFQAELWKSKFGARWNGRHWSVSGARLGDLVACFKEHGGTVMHSIKLMKTQVHLSDLKQSSFK